MIKMIKMTRFLWHQLALESYELYVSTIL